MPKVLALDFETRSRVDLRKSTVYAYVECPDFAILNAAYSYDGGPVEYTEDVSTIPGLYDPAVIKLAHNANFERVVLSEYRRRYFGHWCTCTRRDGWTEHQTLTGVWVCPSCMLPSKAVYQSYADPSQYECTMALAAIYGLPLSLRDLAKAVGAEDKDSAGTRLINLFCKPNRQGGWNDKHSHPDQWAEFRLYVEQDVLTLVETYHCMPTGWPAREREVWVADAKINDRGVMLDNELVDAATRESAEYKARCKSELEALLGVTNANSIQQLKKALAERGLAVEDLQAATVASLLDGEPDGDVRAALLLKQEISLGSLAKYEAAQRSRCRDGRFRGAFAYYGAHTGRWAGRRIQMQNLPRLSAPLLPGDAALADLIADKSEREEWENERRVIAVEAYREELVQGLGSDPKTMKALLRGIFICP